MAYSPMLGTPLPYPNPRRLLLQSAQPAVAQQGAPPFSDDNQTGGPQRLGLLSGLQAGVASGQRPALGWLGQNSAPLLMASMGLLLGSNPSEQAQLAMAGLTNGVSVKMAKQKQAREDADRQRQTTALQKALTEAGLDPGLADIPSVAGPLLANAMRPAEPLKPTDDIREFEFAKQNGYDGTFSDWMRIRSPQTTVDARTMGTIQPGYRVIYDDKGNPVQMEPIPGSPAAAAQGNQRGSQVQHSLAVVDAADRILSNLEGPDSATAPAMTVYGPAAAVTANIPGMAAFNVARELDTIRGTIGIQQLQEMRASNPNGAALGNVTEAEHQILQATVTSVDQRQTDFPQKIKFVKALYSAIAFGVPGIPPDQWQAMTPEQKAFAERDYANQVAYGGGNADGWQNVPDMPGVRIREVK